MSVNDFPNKPTPVLLAALAIVFISGCSGGGGGLSQSVLDETARALASESAQLTAAQLSDAIIAGNRDMNIIDLRSSQDFAQGSIKGSRNLSMTDLLSADGRSSIGSAAMPLLVSASGVQAAQASTLLKLAGVDAQVLAGGYEAWSQYLSPGPGSADMDADSARDHAKRQAAACWFEGDYVAAAGLVPRGIKTAAAGGGGGYKPPMEPVNQAKGDPLGLGLGLGLGPPPEEKPKKKKKGKLKVREGC